MDKIMALGERFSDKRKVVNVTLILVHVFGFCFIISALAVAGVSAACARLSK